MNTTKVCVVTGSSSGIGAATALLFASKGWNVVVNYSRSAEPAETIATQCRVHGVEVLLVKCNVANDGDCRRLAAEVDACWGRVDVLVNNAGTTRFVGLKDLDGLSGEDFHSIYDVNVVGAYQMTRALAPLLKRNPVTAIVNISSVASMMGIGSSIAYMASKGALNAMTVGLARSLGPDVRVNAIAPGLVDTPWLRQGHGEVRYAAMVDGYKDMASISTVGISRCLMASISTPTQRKPPSKGFVAKSKRPECRHARVHRRMP